MNNSEDKKPSLLSLQGGRNFLEFMRNLTPQVLVGSMSIIFTLRATETGNILLWFVSLIMWFVFLYITIANYLNFIEPVLKYLESELGSINGYMTKSDTVGLKFTFWVKGLINNIYLTSKFKKKVFFELLLLLIFIEIPSMILLFASATSATQIYSFIFNIK